MSELALENRNPLGYEKITKLIKKFAVPSIIAMIISSLYNIVDQIFIGKGVGMLGNAATNVSFPFTTICIAIALLIGVGSSAKFSISLGRNDKDAASKVVSNAIFMMIILGSIYLILGQIFLIPLLNAFGATSENFPYAYAYSQFKTVTFPDTLTTF